MHAVGTELKRVLNECPNYLFLFLKLLKTVFETVVECCSPIIFVRFVFTKVAWQSKNYFQIRMCDRNVKFSHSSVRTYLRTLVEICFQL